MVFIHIGTAYVVLLNFDKSIGYLILHSSLQRTDFASCIVFLLPTAVKWKDFRILAIYKRISKEFLTKPFQNTICT